MRSMASLGAWFQAGKRQNTRNHFSSTMKHAGCWLIAGLSLSVSLTVTAATRYVNVNCLASALPYATWETAATNIQDAVDVASDGDAIWVTNGVYQTGGCVVYGSNRVAVTRALTVQSVNGPGMTIIEGYQVPGETNGDAAIRCVYLTNGAVLSGFTLTNGATRSVYPTEEESGGGVWCASTNAVVTNCTLSGNAASQHGGGAYSGTLHNCTLSRNWARSGGGGAYAGTLHNCTLSGNWATYDGGGAYYGTLNNSTLNGNWATWQGGGASYSTLNNCTLSGNSAAYGGGAFHGTLNNCIIYYNTAPRDANFCESTLNYCCTTPMPSGGTGNRVVEPELASVSNLSAGSPCRAAGSAAYATGVDMDGESWLSPPSIGCDEYPSGSVTGALSVAISVPYTNVAEGFLLDLQASISGRVSASRWEFGDGTVVSNRPYASHAWAAAGDYVVVLRAYNASYPDGVPAATVIQVVAQPVHYVSLDSGSPDSPYSSWGTAATNIQDAVNASWVAGALLLVSNGVYRTGGTVVYGSMTNRVAVTKALTVQSVNGPGVTMIEGYQVPGTIRGDAAIRCVYLTDGAVLSGFTLTNGATRTGGDAEEEWSGGGIWCASAKAIVTNCTVRGNSANTAGGGAWSGTLNNCTLSGNSAGIFGGGAEHGTLNNCKLSGNSAMMGGGAHEGTLNNCTLSGNSASYIGGGASIAALNNCIVYYNSGSNYNGSVLNHCCTTPLPADGMGNITNAPLFVNLANGDFHLETNSPCVNAGNNAWAPGLSDLDGNPRIADGTVDLGAYELAVAPPVLPEFTSWAWGANGVTLQLTGQTGLVLEIYASTNLTDWVRLATLTNQTGQVLYTDPTTTNCPMRFYRALQLP